MTEQSSKAPEFAGVWVKLERAARHLDELDASILAHTQAHAWPIRIDTDRDPPWKIGVVDLVPVDLPLTAWGVMLGDYAHNARTALDHIVAGLVRTNPDIPASKRQPVRDNQFPVCDTEGDYLFRKPDKNGTLGPAKRDIMLTRVREVDKKAIDAWQPFSTSRPFGAWDAHNPSRTDVPHPFGIIRDINNADKHRVVYVAQGAVTVDYTLFEIKARKAGVGVESSEPESIIEDERGAELFRFRTFPDTNAEVDVRYPQVGPEIGFPYDAKHLPSPALLDTQILRTVLFKIRDFADHLQIPHLQVP